LIAKITFCVIMKFLVSHFTQCFTHFTHT
jgi:hypothetical protein